MTAIARRPGRAAVARLPGHRVALTGTLAEVSATLLEIERGGFLAAVPTAPQPTGVPGQVLVTARLLPPRQPVPVPAPPFWTRRRKVAAAAVALPVVGVIGAAVFLVLSWVVAHWFLFLLLLALPLLAGSGACVFTVTVRHHH